jgi:hypothetical protein
MFCSNSYVNRSNTSEISQQIRRKKESTPYFATTKEAVSVITDYDTFPYPRYFKGEYDNYLPIVAEREAGWRPRHDDAYKIKHNNLILRPRCVPGSLYDQVEQIYSSQPECCKKEIQYLN